MLEVNYTLKLLPTKLICAHAYLIPASTTIRQKIYQDCRINGIVTNNVVLYKVLLTLFHSSQLTTKTATTTISIGQIILVV